MMYTHADIFVAAPSGLDLASFAVQAFAVLDIAEFEERESSYYIDGRYFCSKGQYPKIKATYADDPDLVTYRFWLPISVSCDKSPANELAHVYAKKLAGFGWSSFVPSENWALKGWSNEGQCYEAWQLNQPGVANPIPAKQ